MKNYKKPPVEPIPRYKDADYYRVMAGRLLILSGVVLIVLAVVAAGVL
jgi:hypothetical protein